MLDAETMRITLGAVAAIVLALFYLGVYRPTRSKFSGWWTVALACASVSTSLLLFNGTDVQVFANPVSTMFGVLGATCVWFAMRSLRSARLPIWLLPVAAGAIVIPVVLDDPAHNIWAGNGLLFAYMAVFFGAGTVEMWLAWAARRATAADEANREAAVAYLVNSIGSSAITIFYLVRVVLYYTVGPNHDVFETVAGTGPTTATLLVCLVAVTFSVSTIGWDQQTSALRRRAQRDDLTALLARTEFGVRTERVLAEQPQGDTSLRLVMADLDHFKAINDGHGHAAGDRALVEFAQIVKDSLRPGEFAGRLGGEEFGLLLHASENDDTTRRLDAMSEAFAARSAHHEFQMPTVSYGVTPLSPKDELSESFMQADFALYLAKADGRDRAVVYSTIDGHDELLRERRLLRDAGSHI